MMKKKFFTMLFALGCIGLCAESINLTDVAENGIPKGWRRYGKNGVCRVENGVLRITDQDSSAEWGIRRDLPIPGPGKYEFSLEVSVPEGGNVRGNVKVQLMTMKDKKYQISYRYFRDIQPGKFTRVSAAIEVSDPGIKNIMVYIYSSYKETCDYLVRNADFSRVGKSVRTVPARTGGKFPPPKPIEKLKDLYLETPLKNAVLAPGDSPALRQAAARLAAKFGAKVVDPASIGLPLETHVIALGNRANNIFINHLYRRGFCYTDHVYPGKGGYELRSIHNPTGRGFNVILCGGSDDAGAVEAAGLLEQQPPVAGHLMKLKVPGFIQSKVDPYDANHYYLVNAGGYYGWNYLSGMLALFYQTGNEFYAREFLRLAFPDAKAKKDFQKFNQESIELPDDPLAGPYHYCASQMILLWDLVEEHPVFSNTERLKVTNGFVRQWKHHIKGTRPAGSRNTIGSRHGQWSSISLFVLGRYFNRDYPAPVWQDAVDRAVSEFALANDPDSWIEGECGILAWFVSGSINPTAQFSTLTEMTCKPDGALANALKFMQTQWDGGRKSEILKTAHRQAFYLISELTGDGHYIWFADLLQPYVKGKFKIGASFSPSGRIAKQAPTGLLNTWTAAPMKRAEHRLFHLTAPLANCYLGLGWRDTLDETGDWISFNCFNESYRTPFKLLSLNGLRLNGKLLLQGFGNYVQPTRSGTVPSKIPVVGQVYSYGSAGNSVFMTGGVPDHAFSAWERSLLLRKRDFVLIADTVTPLEAGSDLTVNVNFQSAAQFVKDASASAKLVIGRKTLVSDMTIAGRPDCTITWGPRNTLFYTKKVGDRAVITFPVTERTTCSPVLTLYDHCSRAGTVNIFLDGRRILSGVPHYATASGLTARKVPLGTVTLTPGDHTLEIEVASIHPAASDSAIGAGKLELNDHPSSVETLYLTGSAGELVLRSAQEVTLRRRIKCDPRCPVTTFSLFRAGTSERKVSAITLDDRAALFRLPEPMLVFTGSREIGSGTLVTLETSGVAGTGVTAVGKSFHADSPVMLDWRFGGMLAVSGKPGAKCTVNGKPYVLNEKGVLALSGLTPEDVAALRAELRVRADDQARRNAPAVSEVRSRLVELLALPAAPRFITPYEKGFLVGAGQELIVLDPQYGVRLRFKLSAEVQCAAASDDLFFAGCRNEELAAFDKTGKKVWSFTSVLAPSVKATQKYYWFKSRYPGIFSLAVRDGKVFAGSACTMEVVDFSGKLIARLPQPWGPCRQISVIDQPDGSYNVVGLRNNSTDSVNMWAWNNRKGTNITSYRDNVRGFRHFPSWGSLYRTRAFVGRFTGGSPELMTDAQGIYTWINLYSADGTPARQVNLGPGRIICDWTVGDFTGDKRPEAAILTFSNELLALDGKCEPLWNADIPFRARLIAVDSVGRRIAVAGAQEIAVFDGQGKLLHTTRLPDNIGHLWCNEGRIYVICGRSLKRVDFQTEVKAK